MLFYGSLARLLLQKLLNYFNMGDLYSAADIVGKTLIASVQVPVYNVAADNVQPFGYIKAGQPVGVVYSWLDPNASLNRSGLWWIFQQNGTYYYTPQKQGWYNVEALQQQGVISTQDKINQAAQAAADENRPWYEKLIRSYGLYVLGTVVVISIIKKKL